MNGTDFTPHPSAGAGANPGHAELFASLVLQQSSMAMMFLGKTPHPESGQTVVDLDAAQVFIDTLAMLEARTRGNLSKEEERFLAQTLMSLRMSYVEAVNAPAAQSQAQSEPAPAAPSADAPKAAATSESESHKKFSKKY